MLLRLERSTPACDLLVSQIVDPLINAEAAHDDLLVCDRPFQKLLAVDGNAGHPLHAKYHLVGI